MTQHTLELSEDCRRIEELLKNSDVSDTVSLKYPADNKENNLRYNVKRKYNKCGYPLIHAQEIYSNKKYHITEDRTYNALNELVKQDKAKTHTHSGLLWYALHFP